MTPQEITALFEAIMAQENASDGINVYCDYSGRFMYGEDCFALYTANRWQGDSIQEYMREHDLSCGRCDSMGMGVVLYWPGLTLACLTESQRDVWDYYKNQRDRRERIYEEDDDD